ncbi:MAG: hypothetical protein M0027_16075 [Candidatus Dormibacteraeota bacterium]|nr:hypothetical protein [Candidatus Dormibacteraeota bacterium]
MPSRLSGATRALALEIVRCPVLEQCIADGGHALPCHRVAAGPGGPHAVGWFPEPWVGHLTQAPLLFVSSNPGGGGPPISDPDELCVASADDDLLDWADGAFDVGQKQGVADGAYLVDAHGRRRTWVHYWGWVLRCAREILPEPVIPGRGYALTEVVHCGGPGQQGVWEALETCTSRYLNRVLSASPARVLIVVGAIARYAFEQHLGQGAQDHLLGPLPVAGRRRILVLVPHPNSRGGNVALSRHLSEEQLELLRGALRG